MVGIVCDTIYVDVEFSQPLACLDPATGRWRSSIDGTMWPEIVFAPAARPVIVAAPTADAVGGNIPRPTCA